MRIIAEKAGLKELRAIGLKGFLFAKLGEYIEKKLEKLIKTTGKSFGR